MNDKPKKLIKNKPSVIVGTLFGLCTVLYFTEFCQYFIASIFELPSVGFNFGFIYIIAEFQLSSDFSIFLNALVLLSPLIVLFTITQLVAIRITKTELGTARYTLMLYQLILVGYVLFYLFYQAVTILIDIDPVSDFSKLTVLLELEYPYNIFGIFFIIFILAIYININARKISKYVNK